MRLTKSFAWHTAQIAFTFFLGIVGAGVALLLRLPLPWMVGPLFLLTGLSVAGANLKFPEKIREPIFALVGIYLGSSIAHGGSLFQTDWTITLTLMVCFTLLTTFAGFLYFKKVAHYSERESFLAALPGALAYIAAVIVDCKLPPAKIILAQSIRVLLVVGLAPFVYRMFTGSAPNEINILKFEAFEFAWLRDLAIASLSAAPLIWIWLKLKAPNAWFLGGMIASILYYLSGFTDQKLPTWILQVLLVIIGIMIGLRFAGTKFRELITCVLHGFNAALILLAITFIVSWGSAYMLGIEPIRIFLAFAPGGVHEMAIIAFAYSIEPIFVTFHHMLRIFLISFLIPIFIGRLKN